MTDTYQEAMEFISSARRTGNKNGLAGITALLGHMGNPHIGLRYVHIAGTNGKGSVAAYLAGILMEAGYKTGLYTSPYIHRFNERVRVCGAEIPDADVARIAGIIREKCKLMAERGEGFPTQFEVVTALGFQYFRDRGCDIVVLETGLGGRLDSTNVIGAPEAAVITAVDYDHTDILGGALARIAAEKAGIIKGGEAVVSYPQAPEADAVIAQTCREKGSRLYRLDGAEVTRHSRGLDGQSFDFRGYKDIKLSMLAGYQCMNAALAVMAAEALRGRGFDISERDIHGGLFSARWPGRFELLRREPAFIADSAHNPQGAAALAENLREYFPGQKITFIVGVSDDKDCRGMINSVLPIAKRFIATQADSPRALPADSLAGLLRELHGEVHVAARPKAAAEKALGLCGRGEAICSFGSLFHVGAVREFFGLGGVAER